MDKERLKEAFEAGRKKEYYYDKSGVGTGYYTKWNSFEHWYATMILNDTSGIIIQCYVCGSDLDVNGKCIMGHKN